VVCLIVVVFAAFGNAQFAVTYKYNSSSYPTWEEISFLSIGAEEIIWEKLPDKGHEIGLAYWFRLKKRRLEFYPEVFASVQQSAGAYESVTSENNPKLSRKTIGLQMTIQAYPMDFANDCNCPTFSKDGNFLTKGFFVGISPGYAIHRLSFTSLEQDQIVSSSTYRLGGFLGIDIGINTLITISPLLYLNYSPSVQWDNIENILNGTKAILKEESSIIEVQPGIKVSFRPDYRKEQRRWR